MVPKTLYPQPLIQLRALITLLVLNLTARKLKAHQSSQWSVIKRNAAPKRNFKWRENKVKFLGARLDLYWPNCHFKIELYRKVGNIQSCWEYRRLTLIGKIQVIKRLALSQLTYILTLLATNQKFINEINDICIFLVFCNWNNKLSRCVKFL